MTSAEPRPFSNFLQSEFSLQKPVFYMVPALWQLLGVPVTISKYFTFLCFQADDTAENLLHNTAENSTQNVAILKQRWWADQRRTGIG